MRSKLIESSYTASFLRAYRSLQLGLLPNEQDLRQVTKRSWENLLEQAQLEPCCTQTDFPVMPEADKLALVENWLAQTQGWVRLRAGYEEGRRYEAKGILLLASMCEWASLEALSQLPDVQQGLLYPVGLELGWGNRRAAYCNSISAEAKIYFFTAYRLNLGSEPEAGSHNLN